MGTNYYAIPKATDELKRKIIEKINNEDFEAAEILLPKRIHLGKSSIGWKFIFNHNDWKYFKKDRLSLDTFLKSCTIYDEYNKEISYGEFCHMVKSKNLDLTDIHCSEYFGLQFSKCTNFC